MINSWNPYANKCSITVHKTGYQFLINLNYQTQLLIEYVSLILNLMPIYVLMYFIKYAEVAEQIPVWDKSCELLHVQYICWYIFTLYFFAKWIFTLDFLKNFFRKRSSLHVWVTLHRFTSVSYISSSINVCKFHH